MLLLAKQDITVIKDSLALSSLCLARNHNTSYCSFILSLLSLTLLGHAMRSFFWRHLDSSWVTIFSIGLKTICHVHVFLRFSEYLYTTALKQQQKSLHKMKLIALQTANMMLSLQGKHYSVWKEKTNTFCGWSTITLGATVLPEAITGGDVAK